MIEAESVIKLFETNDDNVAEIKKTLLEQTTLIQDVTGWQFRWDKLIATDDADEEHYTDYIQFLNGNITLGSSKSNVKLNMTNELINFTDTDGNELARFQKNAVYLGLDSKDSIIDLCNGTGTIMNANTDESHNYNRLSINSTDSIELNAAKITKIVSESESKDGHFISTIAMNAGTIPWSTEFDTVLLGAIVLKSEDKTIETASSFTLHPVGFQYEDGRGNITSSGGSLKVAMNDTEFVGTILKVPNISLPSPKLTWSEAKSTIQCITSVASNSSNFFPVARIETFNNHQWLLGGLNNKVYIAGQYANRTANGIDWYTTWDVDSGLLTHSKNLKVNGTLTTNGAITSATNITSGGHYYMKNAYALFGKDTSGENINLLNISSNNNVVLGYGGYENTNIYGYKGIRFYIKQYSDSNGNPIGYKPYYEPGDTLTIYWDGAGFITNSGLDVRFTIPVSKPIIFNPFVNIVNIQGLRIRQNGKYIYGSSSTVWTTKVTYNAVAGTEWVRITAEMPYADNDITNNSPCGIEANIKITFS